MPARCQRAAIDRHAPRRQGGYRQQRHGLKDALSGDRDLAALEECERGEDAALGRYRDAIKKALPSDVATVVQRQYEGVKRNHDQVRSLRDQVRSTA